MESLSGVGVGVWPVCIGHEYVAVHELGSGFLEVECLQCGRPQIQIADAVLGFRWPLGLMDLEKALTRASTLKSYWEMNSEFPNTCNLRMDDQLTPVTFDRQVFDLYPETLRLVTYGEPLLEALLDQVRPLVHPEEIALPLVRYEAGSADPLVCYYALSETNVVPILTLRELIHFLENAPPSGPDKKPEGEATLHFEKIVDERRKEALEKAQKEHQSRLLAMEEQGRDLLVRAALCDRASTGANAFQQYPTGGRF